MPAFHLHLQRSALSPLPLIRAQRWNLGRAAQCFCMLFALLQISEVIVSWGKLGVLEHHPTSPSWSSPSLPLHHVLLIRGCCLATQGFLSRPSEAQSNILAALVSFPSFSKQPRWERAGRRAVECSLHRLAAAAGMHTRRSTLPWLSAFIPLQV